MFLRLFFCLIMSQFYIHSSSSAVPSEYEQLDRNFQAALENHDKTRVLELIELGADANYAFRKAIEDGNYGIALELIELGVNPNQLLKNGNTFLHFLVRSYLKGFDRDLGLLDRLLSMPNIQISAQDARGLTVEEIIPFFGSQYKQEAIKMRLKNYKRFRGIQA